MCINDEIIKDYLGGVPVDVIAKKFTLTVSAVQQRMSKLKVKRKNKVWLSTDTSSISYYKDQLIAEYKEGNTIKTLSNKYKFDERTISNMLKKENISILHVWNTKYTINSTYFERIDTDEKAYFLGLLFADGWHSPEKFTVGIQLQEQDKHILEYFKNAINSSKPLMFLRKRKTAHQNAYRLTITNREFSKIVLEAGMVKAKSNVITFPKCVPSALYASFIRGYFDGDGCVYKRAGTDRLVISIEGTKPMLYKFQEVLQDWGIKPLQLSQRNKGSATYTIKHSKKEDLQKFFLNIYKNSSCHLYRKYNKFINSPAIQECIVDKLSN